MKKKTAVFSLIAYIFSALLFACGILSVAACHQNISAQLLQGVPFKGNELIIANLYLQNAAPYLAYSALLFLGGRLYRIIVTSASRQTEEEPPPEDTLPVDDETYYDINGERLGEELYPDSWS